MKKYITDAAKEYAKMKAKDEYAKKKANDNKKNDLSNLLIPLLTAKYNTLTKIRNLIDDFNNKWSAQIDKIESIADFAPGDNSVLYIDIDELKNMLKYNDVKKTSFEIKETVDRILSDLDEDEVVAVDPTTHETYTDDELFDHAIALLKMPRNVYEKILNIINDSIADTGFTEFRILPINENKYILCGFWPGSRLTDILNEEYKGNSNKKFIKYYDKLKALITSSNVDIVSSDVNDIIKAAHNSNI